MFSSPAFDGDFWGRYTIPCKPVRFDNVVYRSELEARVVLLWREIGVKKLVYEPRVYRLPDDTLYLPDLRIWMPSPHGDRPYSWEVKPRCLNARETRALCGLSERQAATAFAFCGKPWDDEYTIAQTYADPRTGRVKIIDGGVLDQIGADIVLVFPNRATRLVATGERYALERAFRLAKAGKFESAAPQLEEAQQLRLDGIA